MKHSIHDILKLSKFSISVPVGITAFTGYILADGIISIKAIVPLIGILFLSASASALNQIQEYKADSKMKRTENRPIPSGRINIKQAWVYVLIFWLLGTASLSFTTPEGLVWGWLGMIWYNLIYTPLKKKSAFSVFPGALVGAIPPIAGWMAAGGSFFDPRLHFLAMFFFLGQMPHFWLLVTKYGPDYKKGGFPTLYDYFTDNQIKRINSIWLIATFVSAILLPITHVVDSKATAILLIVSSLAMMGWVARIYWIKTLEEKSVINKKLFIGFNSYYLLVMLLITLDQIIV